MTKILADLQIHSPYARAVSKFMLIPEMLKWANWKGINLLGTGDCTHPDWLKHLKEHLIEDNTGLLASKTQPETKFMIQGEVSLIYSQGGRGRRVHLLIFAPSFQAIEHLNKKLAKRGNLLADGRPIIGMSSKQLLELVLETNEELQLKENGLFLIPAHVWTPWFGLYGSKSGFDSLEECFEELTPHVRAIETGLSSDPLMNWRLSKNDDLAIVSFSDAHSAPNMMREATILSVESPTYANIAKALQNPRNTGANHIHETLEFFPEEGKYHLDGIADQNLRLLPSETARLQKTNPALAKKVTVGVQSRVEDLADRPLTYRPTDRPTYRSLIPLQEIIADVLKVGKQSKKVQGAYLSYIEQASEYELLVEKSKAELTTLLGDAVAWAVMAVREGKVAISPGYDGLYGTIKIDYQEYNTDK
jgi:uncharacterized protein (TIGR00375 family)